MCVPRGFGKNYFTFSSVLAHNVAPKLHAQVSRATVRLQHKTASYCDECEQDDPPLLETVALPCVLAAQPCHCNRFYELKTRLTLLINLFIPRCPYYTTCFAFRRTGVHPPLSL